MMVSAVQGKERSATSRSNSCSQISQFQSTRRLLDSTRTLTIRESNEAGPVSGSITSLIPSGGFDSKLFTSLATLASVRGGRFSDDRAAAEDMVSNAWGCWAEGGVQGCCEVRRRQQKKMKMAVGVNLAMIRVFWSSDIDTQHATQRSRRWMTMTMTKMK